LRSRHFYAHANHRARLKGPVEFSAGLVRLLGVPRSDVRLLALAVACDRQGQELFAPPNVRGWVGGRTWLNSTTLLQRGKWCNALVWGNAELGMPPYDAAAWARDNGLTPDRAAQALAELLLDGALNAEDRALVQRAGAEGGPEGLRRALQLLLHCPE